MKKDSEARYVATRDRERENINRQVETFLKRGGQIEVLGSAFDQPTDPKCRLGDEAGFFG
ncbi:Uncharacterised protein [BD1-7 clade bacterium]|uniref:Transcriptional regulator SutA RNAP-binding domain-containing protein n=1 Tax=BD1-7 clade bacterium TaxID=2029982 RepID=A0A5S9NM81_9GAMM|nr:Uncharacterised protein [BD1-7 clade bacterium]CAA0093946.1 Uncharacterised protein [BD1-7 clade bacterium]